MRDAPQEEAKPRVLVVDDEVVICDVLRDFLQFEGYQVDTAYCGEDATEVLARQTFDVVLTDLKMPGIGGLELLRRVSERGGDTLTVIMTGFGTVETAIEAMKIGAFDYILKPFKPEEVGRVLRRAVDKLQMQRENLALRQILGLYELSEALSSSMPLDEQLGMILDMVRENFLVDGVSVIVEDPHKPGEFVDPVAVGPRWCEPRFEALRDRFCTGEPVVAHGDEVREWVRNPSHAEGTVHAFMAAPLRVRGALFGALCVYSLRETVSYTEGQRKGLAVLGSRTADAIDTARLHDSLKDTFTQTIEGFARALEAKDPYTHGHSDRVAMYSRLIAEAMELPDHEIERIRHGGLMHDIGKIGISSTELNKPEQLTPAEYVLFKSHPVLGRRIIEPITFLANLLSCIYHHHEAWDGTGYPEGLAGTDIPLVARILAVADSYDAMTSSRPYRRALAHEVALREVTRCAGQQFDPQCVEAFVGVIDSFRESRRARGLSVPE